jgi:hypothetical protein
MQVISQADLDGVTEDEKATWRSIKALAQIAREQAGHAQHYTLEFAAFDIMLQADKIIGEKK